jgi:ABC-type oligopeptide transport system substrate-binding subunit
MLSKPCKNLAFRLVGRPAYPCQGPGEACTGEPEQVKRLLELRGRALAWATKAVVAPAAAIAVLVTAGAAVSAPPPPNVLQIDLGVDIDYVDPALSYYVPAWQIEYATCSRLVNYPDASAPAGSVLRPEIAAGLPAVSPDGRTYTFTLRDDYFFSPPSNERVTAAHFKYAIDRTLNHMMNSPAQPFMQDIVGVDQVISGQATTVSGVVANGNTLTIQLKQPAGDFLARVAMPFFCPLPTSVPIDPEGIDAPVPSAGPYYIDRWTRNQDIVIKENLNYAGDRPHHFDEIHYSIGLPLDTIKQRVEAGDADFGDLPPAAHAELGLRFGPGSPAALAGRQRYFFYPAPTVLYLAMNHDRPLFGSGGPLGNVNLKKAVNYAIDRTAMMEQRGAYAGEPTDQHLPRGIRGFRDVEIYPSRPDIARARELAGWSPGDPMRNGVFYCSNRAPAPQICEIVRANLLTIGLDMEIKLFPRATQFELAGRRGEPFDMTLEGWHMDYYDPFDFLFLLDGTRLTPVNNANFAYFNDPGYNQRINAANLLAGDARADAFGALDVDIAQNAAPWAAYGIPNDRLFFSDRVGCETYVPKYGVSLGALCLRPAIAIDDVSVSEGDSGTRVATFTVRLAEQAPADYPITVDYATSDGTAGPSDYESTNGTLTFQAAETTKVIAVAFKGDATDEPDESFSVGLSNPSSGTLVRSRGTAAIADDDAAPLLGLDPVTAAEGDALGLDVTLSGASEKTVTVRVRTADGTARAPGDFAPVNQVLTFAPGDTSETLSVESTEDGLDEDNETFTVSFSDATNAQIPTGAVTGTITDDDDPPRLTIRPDTAVVEGGAGEFAVELDAASGKTVAVGVGTVSGSAHEGSDYIRVDRTLTFSPGETSGRVTINTIHDLLDEADESLTVSLSSQVNASPGDPPAARLTITDNDQPPALRVDDVRVGEGAGPARFLVVLSAPSGLTILARYETQPGTAGGEDFTAVSGNLAFAPGDVTAAIDVPITTDALDEPDELFRLAVTSVANLTGAQLASATIVDDDAAPTPPPPPAPSPPSPPPPPPAQARCVVPNVRGKTVAQARRMLSARRCALGRVARAYSGRVKIGRIISQSRRPALRLPRGTRVRVVVSRGRRR